MIAGFPVYRTYVRAGGRARPPDDDAPRGRGRRAGAEERRPDLDPRAVRLPRRRAPAAHGGAAEDELRDALPAAHRPGDGQGRRGHRLLRYNRLVVAQRGGRRPRPLRRDAVDDFHAGAPSARPSTGRRRCSPPRPTTPSAARTCAPASPLLSEIPERWAEAVRRWSAMNERHRRPALPDRNAEYLLYQTLVGAWPLGGPGAGLHGEGGGGQGAHLAGSTPTPATRRPWPASSRAR